MQNEIDRRHQLHIIRLTLELPALLMKLIIKNNFYELDSSRREYLVAFFPLLLWPLIEHNIFSRFLSLPVWNLRLLMSLAQVCVVIDSNSHMCGMWILCFFDDNTSEQIADTPVVVDAKKSIRFVWDSFVSLSMNMSQNEIDSLHFDTITANMNNSSSSNYSAQSTEKRMKIKMFERERKKSSHYAHFQNCSNVTRCMVGVSINLALNGTLLPSPPLELNVRSVRVYIYIGNRFEMKEREKNPHWMCQLGVEVVKGHRMNVAVFLFSERMAWGL
jgi:hypothetical protein